jgi:hypothetical protein
MQQLYGPKSVLGLGCVKTRRVLDSLMTGRLREPELFMP